MCQISIRIPDAVMYDTHMSEEEAAAFCQMYGSSRILYAE